MEAKMRVQVGMKWNRKTLKLKDMLEEERRGMKRD